MTSDAARDEARREVATRGLTPVAAAHLTQDALGTIDFAALAPVKRLLKRFFSDEPWTTDDDAALAELVGAGEGWWRRELDEQLVLEFGWRDAGFRIEVGPRFAANAMFDGPVVPEATPNPRSIRFVTPPIHAGPSRWYESAAGVDDPRVVRLFTEFDAVANVLVGPAFVAVGVHLPDQWERLLEPMLRAITAEFASGAERSAPVAAVDADQKRAAVDSRAERVHGERALERAWKTLGSLRPDAADDLDQILAAVSSEETAERQVAARVLENAEAGIAEREWSNLLGDASRTVRRATVDAMVDAERPALRPLLERALRDPDAWTRWKALRGLVTLGVEPSRAAVVPLAQDPDFRVRLEATGALRA